MDSLLLAGPSLLVLLVIAIAGARRPTVFLFGLIAARALLDSWPGGREILVGGISLLQVYSLASFGLLIVFLLFVRGFQHLSFFEGSNVPLLGVVIVSVLSALVNLHWSGILLILTKWLWLWAAIGFIGYLVEREGAIPVAAAAFWALLYPLLNQLLMLLSGIGSKCVSGICSYVGTFDHESELGAYLFFGIVVTAILLGHAKSFFAKAFYFVVLVLFHVGLYLNFYRTLLVVTAFFWVVLAVLRFKSMSLAQRALFLAVSIASALLVLYLAADDIFAVIGDLLELFSDPSRYIVVAPDGGGNVAQSVLSGRIYLLNVYLYHYLTAPVESWLIGLGPGAGTEFAGVYAHDQYIGALVETGILGLGWFLGWLLVVGRMAFRAHREGGVIGSVLVAAFFGVVVWCLGTMPFENMRALLLIAFLVSISRNFSHARAETAVVSAGPARPVPLAWIIMPSKIGWTTRLRRVFDRKI